jgi:hypothetical protein
MTHGERNHIIPVRARDCWYLNSELQLWDWCMNKRCWAVLQHSRSRDGRQGYNLACSWMIYLVEGQIHLGPAHLS